MWNGPYKLTQIQNGAFMVFEPNPFWWGQKPYFKRITIKTIENTATLEANLRSGDVDYVSGVLGLSVDQGLAMAKDPAMQQKYNFEFPMGLVYEQIHMNRNHPALADKPTAQVRLVALVADACGSNGMTGGQSMDLAAEGRRLDAAELEHIYRLKTGRLLRASVLAAACCAGDVPIPTLHALERYVDALGLAFQVRDDILDIEGTTAETGKTGGSDLAKDKATYPHLFGMAAARQRADELLQQSVDALAGFGSEFDGLRWAARYIVLRQRG